MNIIEELRELAEILVEQGHVVVPSKLMAITDRLAASGALVPVKVQGVELISADVAEGTYNFVMHGRDVLLHEPYLWSWMNVNGERPKFKNSRTLVQPVHLVRIAEWEGEV